MWHCDELLTIVVIALVNRFVHGHVPTPVNWQKNIKCKHVGLLRTSSVRISFCQDTTCIFNSIADGRVAIVTMHSLRRLIHWTVTMFL